MCTCVRWFIHICEIISRQIVRQTGWFCFMCFSMNFDHTFVIFWLYSEFWISTFMWASACVSITVYMYMRLWLFHISHSHQLGDKNRTCCVRACCVEERVCACVLGLFWYWRWWLDKSVWQRRIKFPNMAHMRFHGFNSPKVLDKSCIVVESNLAVNSISFYLMHLLFFIRSFHSTVHFVNIHFFSTIHLKSQWWKTMRLVFPLKL